MKQNSYVTRDMLVIFAISLLLFLIRLNPEFIAFDTRFALFVQTMFHTGITFFPVTYQGPYPDYPATPMIIIYGLSRLLGQVTPLTAIFPTAVMSAGILAMTYRLGATQSRAWGIYAVLITYLTPFFLQAARSISIDQYTSFITILCFYLIYSSNLYNVYKRIFFIPLLFIMSFALRGPIGLIIPASVCCVYYLVRKQIKDFLLLALVSLFLLVFCSAFLLWAAHYQGGAEFARQVINLEAVSRLNTNNHHLAWLYYWLTSFGVYAIAYPLALFVIIFQFKKIIKPQNNPTQLLFYLFCWLLIVMIGMSIPGAKKMRYILSIVPAISLMAAYLFVNKKDCQKISKRILIPLLIAAMISLFTIISMVDPMTYHAEKTKPFAQQIEKLVAQTHRQIVFYKIGPDAEDIKLAVNLDQPMPFYFIHSAADFKKYHPNAYFISKTEDFNEISKWAKPVFTGKIGHRTCIVFEKKPYE